VDGNRRFDAVFVDLYYLGRLLRLSSVIFLDDYQLPGAARAAAFFIANSAGPPEKCPRPGAGTTWPPCAPAPNPAPGHSTTSPTSYRPRVARAQEMRNRRIRRAASEDQERPAPMDT
jgi:hypothetical protein